MFIVLLNIILSSIVLIVLVCAALFLTAVAIALMIISGVRASKAKKRNQKTHRVGLWIGIAMLLIPWIIVAAGVAFVKAYDSVTNHWDFDKAVVAEAIADKDAEDLYELMAPGIMEENDLTVDDLEYFLDQCDIENNSADDMDRYTCFEFRGEASDPTGNHYRTDRNIFEYKMYYVNDNGDSIFVSGVLYDAKNEDNVGIYYIEFLTKDPDTGKNVTAAEFGEKP